MDFLIKNNITKGCKTVVDIGTYETKLMTVKYAAKNVNLENAEAFDSSSLYYGDDFNYDELARRVRMYSAGGGRHDIAITLPESMVENRIVSFKNRKEAELDKLIHKEYMTFGRVSPLTHVVDYAFLGKHDEGGDMVSYYLISAIRKNVAEDLVSAFENCNLKITTISCSTYNRYLLSELYFDDYEHLNRLVIDFGTNTTSVTALAGGVCVYSRNIGIGFESFVSEVIKGQRQAGRSEICDTLYKVGADFEEFQENKFYGSIYTAEYITAVKEVKERMLSEIGRITNMCSAGDTDISKIYYTGMCLKKLPEEMHSRLGVECEQIEIGMSGEKTGKGYLVCANDRDIDVRFSNAIAMAVYPMI